MRQLFAFAFFVLTFSSHAQLISGDLLDEGRKIITQTDYTIIGSTEGVIYYELAVDREGNVTSARLLGDQTTIHSTPLIYSAKNYCHSLKFEKGTYYPKFHHVVIRVNVVKP